MSLGNTNIPYLQRTWHPTTGCSTGCPDCWAKKLVCGGPGVPFPLAGTMKGLPAGDPFTPTFHPDRLADPLRVRKPSVIGVSFLGDLFDRAITFEQIAAVFGVMAATPWHTYVVLSKQARRMREWFEWLGAFPASRMAGGNGREVLAECATYDGGAGRSFVTTSGPWPLPNVWLGVSVTNQDDADDRLMDLAHVKDANPGLLTWASYEPARGAVDFTRIKTGHWASGHLDTMSGYLCGSEPDEMHYYEDDEDLTDEERARVKAGDLYLRPPEDWERGDHALDAIVMGGLHAPNAAPLNLDWARRVRDDCAAAGCAFALKQLAGPRPEKWPLLDGVRHMDVPWAPWLAHGKDQE